VGNATVVILNMTNKCNLHPHICCPGPVNLRGVSAGNMLTAISVMQHHWQDMVQDLSTGEWCCCCSAAAAAAAAAAAGTLGGR
jgi:hypothetical protein